MESEFQLPTEFTPSQLERLRDLVTESNLRQPTRAGHNLARKLIEYVSTCHRMQGLRRTG